jgi:hypothetical protein
MVNREEHDIKWPTRFTTGPEPFIIKGILPRVI